MSSSLGYFEAAPNPVTILQYKDIADGLISGSSQSADHGTASEENPSSPGHTRSAEIDMTAKVAQERAEAVREAEERLMHLYEQKLQAAKGPIASAIAAFADNRNEYYARVEAEVVQLALAIAKKILHREAQVDPMLVATLVRIAIEKMRDGSSVKLHVSQARVASWKAYFALQSISSRAEVIGDTSLTDQDCLLETELGTANFGLDSQLKEIEQGFFDLLALRPVNR